MSSIAAFGDHMLALARMLYEGRAVTRRDIEQRFNVSCATAKRYMVRLECALPVYATEGERGARVLRIMNAQAKGPAACGRSRLSAGLGAED